MTGEVYARVTGKEYHMVHLLNHFSGVYIDSRYGRDLLPEVINNPVMYLYADHNHKQDSLEHFEQLNYSNYKYVLLANEKFNNYGLQKTKLQQKYGDECLRLLYDIVRSKTNAPIYIADCRPRKLRTWRHIVQYIKKYDMEVGLGIQYHVDLRSSLASPIVESVTYQLLDSLRKASKLPVAITEITVWRTGATMKQFQEAYQRIVDYTKKHATYGLLWTPFNAQEWHWARRTNLESSIYDSNYKAKFELLL